MNRRTPSWVPAYAGMTMVETVNLPHPLIPPLTYTASRG